MNLKSIEKRLLAKCAEPQQLQDITSVPWFECFQTSSPSSFSIASINIFFPINHQGFCKQLSSHTIVAIFSRKHSKNESISGCSFKVISGFEEVFNSSKMQLSEWKEVWRAVSLFGSILKL